MSIEAFEEQVWKLEGIRIVIRAPRRLGVGSYGYEKRAAESFKDQSRDIGWFIRQRLRLDNYSLQGIEIEVIDGRGKRVPNNMLLSTVRASYNT